MLNREQNNPMGKPVTKFTSTAIQLSNIFPAKSL